MKLPEVGNSVVRFFLGLGTLIGGVAAVVGSTYSLGFLTRWVLWNWIITDHSQKTLANLGFPLPFLDISRTYYPEPLIYNIEPLSHLGNNIWYAVVVLGVVLITMLVLFVVLGLAYKIGKDLYGPKNRTKK